MEHGAKIKVNKGNLIAELPGNAMRPNEADSLLGMARHGDVKMYLYSENTLARPGDPIYFEFGGLDPLP